jgi:hypothetical protein
LLNDSLSELEYPERKKENNLFLRSLLKLACSHSETKNSFLLIKRIKKSEKRGSFFSLVKEQNIQLVIVKLPPTHCRRIWVGHIDRSHLFLNGFLATHVNNTYLMKKQE